MDLNRPKPFVPNKNQIAKDWQIWKQEFLIYLRLSGAYEYDKYTEEDRALLLINLMGTEAIKAMSQMSFDHESEKNNMDIMIMKFDEIFDPPLNEVKQRYNFFSRRKGKDENIDSYIKDLKDKATRCNFGSESDKFIVDMVIRSMDSHLRKQMFLLKDLTLSNLIHCYKQLTINNDKIIELSKNVKQNLNNDNSNNMNSRTRTHIERPQSRNPCWFCGTHHIKGSCPAYGQICNLCNEKNHFTHCCKKISIDSIKSENNKPKSVCSKCRTYHPYKQCPAHEEICQNCFTKGHYTSACKQRDTSNKASEVPELKNKSDKKLHSTNKNHTDPKACVKKLENCLWCDKNHIQGQCQHDATCTRCDAFPHNICFQCRKNPHDDDCYFKSLVTLSSRTETNASSVQTCLKCWSIHGISECPATQHFCRRCYGLGHTEQNCYLVSTDIQNFNCQLTAPDSTFQDFVKIENKPSDFSQSHPQELQHSDSLQYRNNNRQSSETKEKRESCSVS